MPKSKLTKGQLRRIINHLIQSGNADREPVYHTPAPVRSDYASKSDSVVRRRGTEEDEDQFAGLYRDHGLLEPPYSFADLWRIYEQCDVLWCCIEAVVSNCERRHDFEFIGDDKTQKDTGRRQEEKRMIHDFFNRVNEKHSFQALRKKIRLDREVTGNAFVEVLRNLRGRVERLYYLPSTRVRVTRLDDEEIPVQVKIPRSGSLVDLTVYRRFRRFGRVVSPTENKLRWFKEFGDPRVLDADTGEFLKNPETNEYVLEPCEYPNKATEVWWFRDNFAGNVYGIPRWVSVLVDAKARRIARWLNYDLLDQGAVPKGILLFQNGTISEGTRRHLEQTLQEWRDPRKYNQWVVLNVEPDTFAFDLTTGASKGGSKPEFINLDRNEDYMFANFLTHVEQTIRKVYRLPPIFTGASTDYTHATAYASLEVAETQVFEPIRGEFDEKVTTELIQDEFGIYLWRLKTRSARISDKETFYKAAAMWAKAGGLSTNHMIQLGNEMLGTNVSEYEGDLYNVPVAWVTAMIANGSIRYDADGELMVERGDSARHE
ncbi:MAG: phage portal protein [Desulfomonilaceae bacterium]|nr:phage portal protein [Desulfomonilaceae bacterium]